MVYVVVASVRKCILQYKTIISINTLGGSACSGRSLFIDTVVTKETCRKRLLIGCLGFSVRLAPFRHHHYSNTRPSVWELMSYDYLNDER